MAQFGPQAGWVPLIAIVPPAGGEGAAGVEGFEAGAEAEDKGEGAGAGAATELDEPAVWAGGGGV